jgi:hypothetical protein
MAAEDDAVLEPEQEVLADSLDSEQPSAVEPLSDLLDRGARVRRLDFDPLADENLEAPGGPCEGVAFRHQESLAQSSLCRPRALLAR